MRQPTSSRRAPRLRFAVALVATFAPLVAAVLGAGACNDNVVNFTVCSTPTVNEKGADGGPDPCHCDPPPSSNVMACGCLSDPGDQAAIDDYNECMVVFHAEQDAGGGL